MKKVTTIANVVDAKEKSRKKKAKNAVFFFETIQTLQSTRIIGDKKKKLFFC